MFKVGDKVKCLSDSYGSVVLGQICTVTEAPNKYGYFTVDHKNHCSYCYDVSDFEVVPENPISEALSKQFEAPARSSSTGSLRYNSGKPQLNEISPKFLLDMGAVLEKSRQKYPRGNWEKGNDYSVPYDSMMRHLLAWQSGESIDKESGLSHLAHAALNLMMLHYYEENYPEFDDRIFKKEKK